MKFKATFFLASVLFSMICTANDVHSLASRLVDGRSSIQDYFNYFGDADKIEYEILLKLCKENGLPRDKGDCASTQNEHPKDPSKFTVIDHINRPLLPLPRLYTRAGHNEQLR